MLPHEISAWGTIHPTDLLKIVLDHIGSCSVILWVPDGARIISHLVVVGVLDLLLDPKLVKDLEVDKAGVKLLPTAPLVLECKARTHNYLL